MNKSKPRKTSRSLIPPAEPSVPRFFGVARLRWLVEFAQQASGPMAPGEERRLIRTLEACLQDVTLRREDDGQVVTLGEPASTAPSLTLPLRREDNQKSVAEKLALIRVTVQTLLCQALPSSIGGTDLQAVVTLRRTWRGDVVRDQPEAHDVRDALAYVLLAELATFGHQLLDCAAPGCRRLFVRERRQRYCSVSCRNRTTFQRWYRHHHKAGRQLKQDAATTSRATRKT